ncbi:MAG: Unknown protein [uncultured Sulfurovum sp.]|uniref:Uncharacterized protein n=1 Tax=uncultured Sulfurovum sp. TaxID=269237 RepID=A0A6S6TM65_9BACT|nr:MAG: Unknown protein [uncultured Sulfurovum sp.]
MWPVVIFVAYKFVLTNVEHLEENLENNLKEKPKDK